MQGNQESNRNQAYLPKFQCEFSDHAEQFQGGIKVWSKKEGVRVERPFCRSTGLGINWADKIV